MSVCKIEVKQKLYLLIWRCIIVLGDNMAKPIASTPIFDENDVEDLKKYI